MTYKLKKIKYSANTSNLQWIFIFIEIIKPKRLAFLLIKKKKKKTSIYFIYKFKKNHIICDKSLKICKSSCIFGQ